MEHPAHTTDVTRSAPSTDSSRYRSSQQAFEQLETQQYQLVLPAEYEELRGYLQNDGLLSDEEITRCLYKDKLDRAELAERIKERLPDVEPTDKRMLTNYLWDVHQTVKGLPAAFIDPNETYRINIIDTPKQETVVPARVHALSDHNSSADINQLSPVTLQLDINGGFLANFLHNAQLNHEQMNRFITDLERQHTELKARITPGSAMNPTQQIRATLTAEQPASKSDQALPIISSNTVSDQRIYTSVRDKVNLSNSILTDPEWNPQQSQSETGAVIAGQSPPPVSTNYNSKAVTMNETRTAGVQEPTPGRQTRYDWAEVATQFDKVGITRQDLEKAGHLDDLLNGRKTGLMKLTQVGEEGKPFQVSGKLYLVNTPDKGPVIGIQPERKQLLVPKEFLGYELTTRDKQNLEKNGEMGKRVELTDKMTGNKFSGYVGVDQDTRSLTVLRAERLHIPQTIKGVTLTKQQQKNLEQGRAIKLNGMTSHNGQTFNAYVQVSAAKRSLTFAKIPDNLVKQTVDQKTEQDLRKPAHQLKGEGAEGKKTLSPTSDMKQAQAKPETTSQVAASKPEKQQKALATKPVLEENKPRKPKKQKAHQPR